MIDLRRHPEFHPRVQNPPAGTSSCREGTPGRADNRVEGLCSGNVTPWHPGLPRDHDLDHIPPPRAKPEQCERHHETGREHPVSFILSNKVILLDKMREVLTVRERACDVAIVGGGTAGLTVAARLMRRSDELDVALIEPSRHHFYQPMWTLNGAGVLSKEDTRRDEEACIPSSVEWIRAHADTVRPEDNEVITRDGASVRYETLVMAPGIQLDWDAVEGLDGTVGQHGICSNYSYDTVHSTWRELQQFSGGTALFTMPDTPVKCPGAPQKIAYLADDYFRRQNVREESRLIYADPGDVIFGVPEYARTLEDVVERKDLTTRFRYTLVALRPEAREAVLKHGDTGEESVVEYDMIHVTPPQSAPAVVAEGPLADDEGWVDVDPATLQHVDHDNVFALGDASNLPTSKTGAAVRKQAPVVVENLRRVQKGQNPEPNYDGYTACPLVTRYGRVVLAEFDYEGNRKETFPFDQSRERLSMYLLKKYLLPLLYWHGMLEGRG